MKRLVFRLSLLAFLIGLTGVARPQENEKLSPRAVVQSYFDGLHVGALQVVRQHRLKDAEPMTQKDLDVLRVMLGGRRLTIQTAWWTHSHRRAIVVSSSVTLMNPEGGELGTGRFVLDMNDTLGEWLISELQFNTDEESAEAVSEFRTRYSQDDVEVFDPATRALDKTNRKLTIFQIEYADATTVSGILNELFSNLSIVVDARTNSLFVRFVEQEDIEELSEVLRLIDQPTKDAGQSSPTDPTAGKPTRQNVNQIPQIQNGGSSQVDVQSIQDWLMSEVDVDYVEAVRATAATAEAESIRTAKRIRGELKNGTDPEQQAEWRAVLRNL